MREIKCIDESFKSLAERNPLRQLLVRRASRLSLALVCIVTGPQENTLDKACQKEEDGPNKTRVCVRVSCRLEITCRPCKLHTAAAAAADVSPLSDEERHEEDDESLGLEVFN